ncbi:MAG: HAMP domain-containing histidine kinase [Muribaculaceae bacterium]|jgi:signal transduction histidine kinase|nr:HAMP domain-containing histidine kinase [Muribaculaceae bacterium]
MLAINRQALTESMVHKLLSHPPYSEQVFLLHNIIDLSSSKEAAHPYYRILFNIAKAHGDVPTQLEAIRNLNTIHSDSIAYFIKYVNSLPKSNLQREAAAFLKYQYSVRVFVLMDKKSKSDYLIKIINQYKSGRSADIYTETTKTMELLSALSYIPTCDMYSDYIIKLGKLVKLLPADGRSILPNVYFSLAPNFYALHGKELESLKADREYLKFLDSLDNKYRKQGRIYRSFDIYRYTCYRRMIMDTTYLSKKEIMKIFEKMKQLGNANSEIYNDLHSPGSSAYIRYYIATNQPLKAKPYIDNFLSIKHDSDEGLNFMRMVLKYRLQIGLMTHDKDLLKYTLKYIDILETDIRYNVNEKAQELQIIYDVNGLTQQVNKLELDKKQEEVDSSHRNTIISIVALLIVTILLFITWRHLIRSRKLALSLKKSQTELTDEKLKIIDTMDKLEKARNDAVMADKMKTLFIQNMDHEIRTPLNAIVGFTQVLTDPEIELENDEKNEYATLILKNNDLLLKLVSDVFDIAQMESGNIQTSIEPCSVNDICHEAYDSMQMRTENGVELLFSPHDTDFTLNTDRQRVLQLLNNYLSNACKFTHDGKIILDYSVDKKSETVTFSVTDTGIGIPAEKAEKIFERFEKVNSFEQGTGLGLHVCRLIAKTLHGEVKLDTSYTGGSRFLFIHPFRQPSITI